MSVPTSPLGELIQAASSARAGMKQYPILSMTMHEGLVDQASKFKKRVASDDTSAYKVVRRGQLVVGFPIDEGVLSIQNLYDEAIVSPAYDVWDIEKHGQVDALYLQNFLKGPKALAFYRSKLKSTTARRRTIPKDTFLALEVPLPPIQEQQRVVAILDQAGELRKKRQSVIAKLKGLETAVFQRMFGDPTSNLHGINRIQLGDLLKVSSGAGLVGSEQNGGSYPVYGGNGINGWHDSYTVPENTIVIGRVGAYCGSVHITDKPSWITDNALVVNLKAAINLSYLAAALRLANLNQYAGRSSQPLVSGSRIYPVEILMPSEQMQISFEEKTKEIAKIVTNAMNAAMAMERLVANLHYRASQGGL